ncbi:FAD-binding protein, partial [Acinetobacter baumannii]
DADYHELTEEHLRESRERIERIKNSTGKEKVAALRAELQQTMMDNASVFRTGELLAKQVEILKELMDRYRNISIDDKGDA